MIEPPKFQEHDVVYFVDNDSQSIEGITKEPLECDKHHSGHMWYDSFSVKGPNRIVEIVYSSHRGFSYKLWYDGGGMGENKLFSLKKEAEKHRKELQKMADKKLADFKQKYDITENRRGRC